MIIKAQLNKKIKIKNYSTKEVIEGVVIAINRIGLDKLVRIKTNNFELSINEDILNTSYCEVK